ncbi:uncharacterized protein LOC136071577 [Quercus suber]|uniref:uncharacterized protein LOC136071577 n=1 Tax=Quercus suber TaxID=58331 RepID=UPI0032DE8839
MITRIWDKYGRWCDDKDSIANAVVSYFEDIYSTSNPSLVEEVTAAFPTRVTDEMNMELSKNFTREEVVTAFKQIHSTKSPRLDENQSVFIANRLITDNVLIAYELVHYLKHKREGKDSFMATKLDMSKAFDRVEWGFIEGVMRKLGFNERWINLVIRCISSVSYSVIINGDTFGNIVPSRGLRQGDPLSPYLFLLCAEGFLALLHEAARNQLLNGISLCKGCPKITHLFFANDSLLFCKANSEECRKLKEILEKYEAVSRQKVNADKSKKQVFAEIKERVGLKLAGWKGKLLSSGGKEILIKAVAQAIPTYTMSCFQLPKSFSKQAWRILTNPSSLAACILKAKYFPYCDVLNASLGSNPSYTWRSIHNSLEVLRKGTRWRVRNGRRIHIWDDKWLPTPLTVKVITAPRITEDYPMVSSLIDPDTRWWKVNSVRALFLPFEANTIFKIPLSFNLPEDKIIWIGNKNGEFSVKSAYFIAVNLLESSEVAKCSSGDPNCPLWKNLWKLELPEKVKIFAWRDKHF